MCLPCWPITKTTHERGSNQRSNPQRYRWHWSRTRNMWVLRDTVTGQDTPLCQMGGYALQGGYMMGPQGPVVSSPAGVTMPAMPAMPGAGMPAMGMFGPQGGPILPSFPGAGIAYSRMQPGMNPLMQMPNGHGHQAFPGSPTPGGMLRASGLYAGQQGPVQGVVGGGGGWPLGSLSASSD